MKIKDLFKIFFIALLACVALTACGDNEDDPNIPNPEVLNFASDNVHRTIQEVFPDRRIDSISGNPHSEKFEYEGDLLISYTRYRGKGIDDGSAFQLKWTRDTLFVKCVNGKEYKATFGENGCVKTLLLPNGQSREFLYDSDKHLIRYNQEISTAGLTYPYIATVNWEHNNVSNFIKDGFYDDDNHKPFSFTYTYQYNSILNKAGLLFDAGWLNDVGLSMGFGIYKVLYYAGVLGKGCEYIMTNEQSHYGYVRMIVTTDENGYVTNSTTESNYSNTKFRTYYYRK